MTDEHSKSVTRPNILDIDIEAIRARQFDYEGQAAQDILELLVVVSTLQSWYDIAGEQANKRGDKLGRIYSILEER